MDSIIKPDHRRSITKRQSGQLPKMEASNTTSSPDILGVRVRASDGARLDATPIFIGSGSSTQYRPAVAFDGNNFLVVWEQLGSHPLIYGARVRASDGTVLDSSPLFISRTITGALPLPQSAPSNASVSRPRTKFQLVSDVRRLEE